MLYDKSKWHGVFSGKGDWGERESEKKSGNSWKTCSMSNKDEAYDQAHVWWAQAREEFSRPCSPDSTLPGCFNGRLLAARACASSRLINMRQLDWTVCKYWANMEWAPNTRKIYSTINARIPVLQLIIYATSNWLSKHQWGIVAGVVVVMFAKVT